MFDTSFKITPISPVGFVAGTAGAFLLLFFFSGVGNASTFQMVPAIFRTTALREVAGQGQTAETQAIQNAGRESAAVLGFTSAIAAYGAFFIPKSFGSSIAATGSAAFALYGFIAFYLSCIVLTWFVYTRRGGLLHDVERRRVGAAATTPAE